MQGISEVTTDKVRVATFLSSITLSLVARMSPNISEFVSKQSTVLGYSMNNQVQHPVNRFQQDRCEYVIIVVAKKRIRNKIPEK